MNMTTKQLISLLLMTITLAVILALLPEHPTGTAQNQITTHLAGQASE